MLQDGDERRHELFEVHETRVFHQEDPRQSDVELRPVPWVSRLGQEGELGGPVVAERKGDHVKFSQGLAGVVARGELVEEQERLVDDLFMVAPHLEVLHRLIDDDIHHHHTVREPHKLVKPQVQVGRGQVGLLSNVGLAEVLEEVEEREFQTF